MPDGSSDAPLQEGQGPNASTVHLGFEEAPEEGIREGQVRGPGWPRHGAAFREDHSRKCPLKLGKGGGSSVRLSPILLEPHT